MSILLQNLRSVTPGVVPQTLAQGQLCFNLADDIMFVGDGSNFQTSFNGIQTPTTLGTGWFAIPLSYPGLSQFFIQNPQAFGDIPTDGQVLAYSAAAGKAVWEDVIETPPTAYVTTNNIVAAAPGSSTTAKISNALGVTPVEGDSVIVTGVSGDLYQGLYLFRSGTWTYAAVYASPNAANVPYNNAGSGLSANNVQAAVDELQLGKLNKPSNDPVEGKFVGWTTGPNPIWTSPTAANVVFAPFDGNTANNVQGAIQNTWTLAQNALLEANSAQDDATAAQVTANIALGNSNTALTNSVNAQNDAAAALVAANAALPKAGGTMTGNIVFNNGQPVDAGTY